MKRPVLAAILATLLASGAAAAPKVTTDIAPVHSLVARVMQGVGEPSLIVEPGASPHGYSMRPSQARELSGAQVVVWVGEALAPWMERRLKNLARGAVALELMAVEGTTLLPYREGATFEGHDHGHAHGHAHGHSHGHAHDHDEMDSHVWLDPVNARLWLGTIAETLAKADPQNATTYRANAAAAQAEMDALVAEVSARLAPVRGRPFLVFHDAYQYFEARFGVTAAGSIALSDASAPSAARVAAVRDKVRSLGATCVFAEPQFEPKLVQTVIEGTPARRGVLDPLGGAHTPGAGLYPAMIRDLADALVGCLASS
jgi:zinc transport system substrate-binding protein